MSNLLNAIGREANINTLVEGGKELAAFSQESIQKALDALGEIQPDAVAALRDQAERLKADLAMAVDGLVDRVLATVQITAQAYFLAGYLAAKQ